MKKTVPILMTLVFVLAASATVEAQTNNGFTVLKDLSVNSSANNVMRIISRTVLPGTVPKLMFPVLDATDNIQVHAYDETNGIVSITPNLYSYSPHNTAAGSLMYFQGGMPAPYVNGQPWVTDGTPGGSYQLITVQSSCGYLNDVCATTENGITYLRFGEVKCRGGKGGGATGISGMNAYLYKTDGTAVGTVKLKSWSGSMSAGSGFYHTVGNWCLFFGYDGNGVLWRTNGTSKGTTALKSFTAMNAPVVVGAYSIFPANDGVSGLELWRSDATAAGTTLVANIASGSASSTPDYLTVLGTSVYFAANDGTGGKLYRYDPGPNTWTSLPMNGAVDPKWLTVMDGKLYYSAWTETAGRELWVYDPSPTAPAPNPRIVMDFLPGAGSGDPHYGETVPTPSMNDHDRFFAVLGGYLYFAAKTGSSDYILCRSDGITVESVAGPNVTRPNSFTVMGGKLYFIAYDATNGYQLYKFNPAQYTPPTPKTHDAAVSPEGISLGQNYPNPFNPNTVISYMLPEAVSVTLVVSDMLGREVARLVDGESRSAGTHRVRFDASGLPSGMYLYRLESAGAVMVRKMVLMR